MAETMATASCRDDIVYDVVSSTNRSYLVRSTCYLYSGEHASALLLPTEIQLILRYITAPYQPKSIHSSTCRRNPECDSTAVASFVRGRLGLTEQRMRNLRHPNEGTDFRLRIFSCTQQCCRGILPRHFWFLLSSLRSRKCLRDEANRFR